MNIIIGRSSNLKHEYPSLYTKLKVRIKGDCPTAVALGPHGHYFFAADESKYWKLSAEIKTVTAPTNIKQLWLGRNNAFVLVKVSGTIKFNFKGHYDDLSEILCKVKTRGQSIKVSYFHSCQHHELTRQALALDLEDDAYFIMYGKQGWATRLPTSNPYRHFLTENRSC